MAVPPEDAIKYGVIEVAERIDERLVRASRIVEKPPRDQVPSNLAAVAGYVLTPDVFDYLGADGRRPGRRDLAGRRRPEDRRQGQSVRARVRGPPLRRRATNSSFCRPRSTWRWSAT